MSKSNRPALMRVDPAFRNILFIESRLKEKTVMEYTRELAEVRKKNLLKELGEDSSGGGKHSFQFKL